MVMTYSHLDPITNNISHIDKSRFDLDEHYTHLLAAEKITFDEDYDEVVVCGTEIEDGVSAILQHMSDKHDRNDHTLQGN
eukprot:8541915-Ditylum_brightwellii.AAC.1